MRRLRDAHTADNLSPRQFQLLGLLHDHGSTGQGELGQMMETDPSILVTMLNPLEADGLISRQRDPEDRRRHLVSITPTGNQLLSNAASAQQKAEDALFGGLDSDQREQLRSLLVTLRDSLASGQQRSPSDPDSSCDSGASDEDC
jgi:DNA-binding MarR family transcriptional regulator